MADVRMLSSEPLPNQGGGSAERCHIGHRQKMANLGKKPLVWVKGEANPIRSAPKSSCVPGLL